MRSCRWCEEPLSVPHHGNRRYHPECKKEKERCKTRAYYWAHHDLMVKYMRIKNRERKERLEQIPQGQGCQR